ncbi:unnamed protein product [Heligmosomoides polygyrus]|uniref:Uncharacterized protein n=1 Tax=Heligmosomoides polygyrus TaxID=6339 RepID=A0A183G5K1_HELPZ|nr:unnamed protein product [Heligmosomoides polygyrus]
MLLLVVLLLGAAYLFYLYHVRQQRQKELQDVIGRRQQEREKSIARAESWSSKLSSTRRDEIAAWNFRELRGRLEGTIGLQVVVLLWIIQVYAISYLPSSMEQPQNSKLCFFYKHSC